VEKRIEYVLHKDSPALFAVKTIMPLMTRDTLKLFASHFSIPLGRIDLYFGGNEKTFKKRLWKGNN
jgi:hypothetical protein